MKQIHIDADPGVSADGRGQSQGFAQAAHLGSRVEFNHDLEIEAQGEFAESREFFGPARRYAVIDEDIDGVGAEIGGGLQRRTERLDFGPARQGEGIGQVQLNAQVVHPRSGSAPFGRVAEKVEGRHLRQHGYRLDEQADRPRPRACRDLDQLRGGRVHHRQVV